MSTAELIHTDFLIVEKINLEVNKPKENLLKHLNYYSYEERVFDLSELIKSNLDESYTKVIGSNVYEGIAKNYSRKNHLIFNGIYKLAPFDEYLGLIPLKNQLEIKNRFQLLKDNPFLEQNFELTILAPINNFAEEKNIKAIDPICFAFFKKGQNCYEKNYLITLSQWV